MKKFKVEKLTWLHDIAGVVKTASKDQYTKIGSILFDDNYTVLSTGYNSYPRGINDFDDIRQERPEKYFWMEHAERNSIYNAVRTHTDIRNSNMLLTCGIPCADCARAVIQSSVKCIICHKQKDIVQSIWQESCKRAEQMLTEAEIPIIFFEEIL